ncbi:MAG: hypothetical protein KC912_22915 [Proteobacteria bacterium]|nr:hypothetical protein [Pseudomonadota bacterium]
MTRFLFPFLVGCGWSGALDDQNAPDDVCSESFEQATLDDERLGLSLADAIANYADVTWGATWMDGQPTSATFTVEATAEPVLVAHVGCTDEAEWLEVEARVLLTTSDEAFDQQPFNGDIRVFSGDDDEPRVRFQGELVDPLSVTTVDWLSNVEPPDPAAEVESVPWADFEVTATGFSVGVQVGWEWAKDKGGTATTGTYTEVLSGSPPA